MSSESQNKTLIWAVVNGKSEILEQALARGGDVNCEDSYYSLTAYAARHGQTECLKIILRERPNLDVLSRSGCQGTALHCAAERGHTECVRLLLEAGASREIVCNYDRVTADVLAEQNGHDGIAQMIRNFDPEKVKAYPDVRDVSKTVGQATVGQMLIDAVRQENVEKIKQLLAGDAPVLFTDPQGYDAFFYAIHGKKFQLADILLAHGADINKRYKDSTLLMIAALKDDVETIEFLIKRKANLHLKRSDGKTAADIARVRAQDYLADMLEYFMSPPNDAEEVVISRPFGNRVLQETFNFAAHERISLIRKSKYGAVEAMTREGFSFIEDHAAIERAYEMYCKQGGKIPPEEALPSYLAHRKLKFKDGQN